MAILEWWKAGRDRYASRTKGPRRTEHDSESDSETAVRKTRLPPLIAPDTPVPCILASDPVRPPIFFPSPNPFSQLRTTTHA